MWGPRSIAKFGEHNSNVTMVYGIYNELVTGGESKPTNISWGPHIVYYYWDDMKLHLFFWSRLIDAQAMPRFRGMLTWKSPSRATTYRPDGNETGKVSEIFAE